jgi:biopolymer transport protein ExbD
VRIKRKVAENIEINITPIIDMVFLLLIFFLVATKFADIERDVRVDPPSSRNARPITAIPQELVINVTAEGRIFIAGAEQAMEDLDRLLAAAIAKNPQQSVVIRGDKQAMLQLAVNVLDLCERHGIARTYLTTRQSEGR